MRRVSILIPILAYIFAHAFGAAQAADAPLGKLPLGVTPTHYDLHFEIDPSQDRFSGIARIDVQLSDQTNQIWMHGKDLQISEAFAINTDGTRIQSVFEETDHAGIATFKTNQTIGPGIVTLVIAYDAPFNESLSGVYRVKRDGAAYAYTHFEPLNARLAFPSFDEPRFKTPYDISVVVSGSDTAASNGPETAITDLAGSRRQITFGTTAPIPIYLVALAVGDFDVVDWAPIPGNAVRDHPVPLRGIAVKGQGHKLSYALSHTSAV
jgi:alanyl aminopeptidase